MAREGRRARTVALSPPRRPTVADKSIKKTTSKTAPAKTLKEKRVEKKDKNAAKRKAE